jgi:ribose transport system substrate-binding protein
MEAAKAIGWKATVYDAAAQPVQLRPLVSQAIAAHVNGIILDAIDCDTVKGPLEQAKAAGIAVTAMYAFDCNDPHSTGGKVSLFDGVTNYGAKNANLDLFTESYGSDQADYIIAKSHNTAKIIAIQDPEFTVLYYTLKGFDDTIAASHGSQVIATLDITQEDLVDGNVVPRSRPSWSAIPRPPGSRARSPMPPRWASSPPWANPSHIPTSWAGEGFHNELDDISSNRITATNAISSDWTGWAAVDTLNSIFNHTKPVDSGIGWTLVDASHNLPTNRRWPTTSRPSTTRPSTRRRGEWADVRTPASRVIRQSRSEPTPLRPRTMSRTAGSHHRGGPADRAPVQDLSRDAGPHRRVLR